MSLSIWRGCLGSITGMNFRRNFLFRRVTLPDPSIRTTYWSNWRTSTVPVLSHRFGSGPLWFWTLTWSLTANGGIATMCSESPSAPLMCRLRRASSLLDSISCQVSWGRYFPDRISMMSLIGLPKRHIAGDSLVSGSGQFLYCSIALWNASVSRLPFGPVFSAIIRLTVLTPISARQLLWGKATDDSLWWTPVSSKRFELP